jgi:hypothetical protein
MSIGVNRSQFAGTLCSSSVRPALPCCYALAQAGISVAEDATGALPLCKQPYNPQQTQQQVGAPPITTTHMDVTPGGGCQVKVPTLSTSSPPVGGTAAATAATGSATAAAAAAAAATAAWTTAVAMSGAVVAAAGVAMRRMPCSGGTKEPVLPLGNGSTGTGRGATQGAGAAATAR